MVKNGVLSVYWYIYRGAILAASIVALTLGILNVRLGGAWFPWLLVGPLLLAVGELAFHTRSKELLSDRSSGS